MRGRLPEVKFILMATFVFLSTNLFLGAERYKISDAQYDITGKTRVYPLKTNVKIDFKKVFSSEDALINYIKDIKQRLKNTRCFQAIEVDYRVTESEGAPLSKENADAENTKEIEAAENTESTPDTTKPNIDNNEIIPVTLLIKTKDSHHLMIVPYPKYSSSSGFSIKAKAKDTNFVGTMETLNAEGSFAMEQDDEEDDIDYTLGVAAAFKIPFKMGPLECAWDNDYSLSYTIGEDTPEWNLEMGLEIEWPFERISFCFDFYQYAIRDLDYEEDTLNGRYVYYGDGTYFTEKGKFSVPIILQKVENWGNIVYTPYVNVTYNWDADGISTKYHDYDAGDGLLGPVIEIGHKLTTSRVNWIENFRQGLSMSFYQSVTYNTETYTFSPGLELEFQAFKAFKQVGLCADIYAFAYLNSNKKIGDRLRGIRDSQYFSEDSGDDDKKACSTPAAIVVSLDLPIKLFRAEWDKLPSSKNLKHVGVINFEVQLSPFIDFALIKNRSTGTNFSPKDGFLDAGLEVLVYPLKWKGIQLRASFGVDLSRKMPFIKKFFNQEWRDSVSTWELSIGIGLHY